MGRRLVDGMQLRFVPPIEGVWLGTFNLRWWQHVEGERDTIQSPRDGRARSTKIGSAV
ncbi:MAG TPA: hypothetical protein VF990_09550 [Candidatus Dormibacteraeota bacterium]